MPILASYHTHRSGGGGGGGQAVKKRLHFDFPLPPFGVLSPEKPGTWL